MNSPEALYCIDLGTTSCRVFLTEGSRLWARVEAGFGVRDVARGKSPDYLRERLEALIAEAAERGRQAGLSAMPKYAVGAGMLTSRQGLLEIPHVYAPAGDMDLARHMKRLSPSLAGLIELILVPGVRTGPLNGDFDATMDSDVMRGEETLLFGLLEAGQIDAGAVVLNLGSHWKWMWLDEQKRIARSRTAITGELIHVTQSQTLLASGLPQTRPSILHEQWLERGSREARRSGLTRALFCLRLLEQAGQGTPEERLSFLYGVFLEMDILAFNRDESLAEARTISLIGPPALAAAWKERLQRMNRKAQVIAEVERDRAYLMGLRRLFSLARQQGVAALAS